MRNDPRLGFIALDASFGQASPARVAALALFRGLNCVFAMRLRLPAASQRDVGFTSRAKPTSVLLAVTVGSTRPLRSGVAWNGVNPSGRRPDNLASSRVVPSSNEVEFSAIAPSSGSSVACSDHTASSTTAHCRWAASPLRAADAGRVR